ncbi:protein arginine N-methyltransferase 1-B-like [Drosophila tropicalis]|uniref:protein arginine N-methyltransferase 1-B-like n=1 Tax=Drosophila tropicalis TaxID=46794 RepID=UPI0035ABD29F
MEADESVISPSVYLEFLATQEVIIRDCVMLEFKEAMESNWQLFKNAVVLEIGCGSALLSMWAARLGAARVIAQEPTTVAQVARQLVSHNQLDHIIEVIEGDIKEIALPVNNVDVIISKWMGACLMFNTSLDAVLYARDKWLKSGGHIFPRNARLYLTAATENRHYVPPKFFGHDSLA